MGLLRKSREELTIEELIRKLDRFPGSLAEYCQFKKGRYEIMDTGTPEKYVLNNERDLKDVVNHGCEGLIHYRFYGNSTIQSYGVPVRRKQ